MGLRRGVVRSPLRWSIACRPASVRPMMPHRAIGFRFRFRPLYRHVPGKGQKTPKLGAAGAAQPPLNGPAPVTSERKKLAAADFYSALQRSLDGMQQQLSSANNAFAD